ncbi:acyltransferase family protein [Ancylobacter vacuolatus]|uniref:Peptidoglycan/LPS O-acetylase OafA/YrhL n=1 Tax=Ancylobacter vacuolatus TaxID=223389 RepID=A0ABU0DHZ4_9HYPH|nr:acyltransferase family protein [Ancylobacter vacuolatus]MDQ0347938.1 peptidoglycan/LPS O-acetylase OafA/YrhL [Ancylobacter vacuolatus]
MHNPLRYRAHIDGLRAIAVLGVVLFHFGASWLPGGFIGVDVFFVISGFLIAKSLYADVDAGSFSVLGFYERRMRRIAPAFFVVTAATSLAAFLIFFPNQLMTYGRSLIWAVLAFGNVYFYQRTDYFGPSAEETPLLHYWSLGVEEQFYFLFPGLILLIERFAPRARAKLVLGLLVVSLLACEIIRPFNPAAAFYLLPFRAFELLIGAGLALPGVRFTENPRAGGAAMAAGLALILAGMVFITEHAPFPGVLALMPCLGAALAIWGGERTHSLPARLLGWRPLVFFGAISYSLYLVHWPIVVFARHLLPELPAPAFLIGGVAASTLLGWLSWHFVEQPVRQNRRLFGRGLVYGGTAAGAALLIAFGTAASDTRGFPGRLDPEIQRVLAFTRYPFREVVRDGTCFINGNRPKDQPAPECLPDTHPSLVLWGSSHVAQFIGALEPIAKARGYAVGQMTAAACPPLVQSSFAAMCDRLNRFAFDWLLEHRPSIVVIGGDTLVSPEQFRQLDADLARLHAAGIRVILLGPVPHYRRPAPEILAERMYRHAPSRLADDDLTEGTGRADRLMAAHFAGNPNVEFVSLLGLCPERNCPMMIDGTPLQFDPTHFTREGVAYFGDKLAALIFANAPSPAPAP